MKKTVVTLILSALGAVAAAQSLPQGAAPHPAHAPGLPAPELLATNPDLTAAQQAELRKVLADRRDAHEGVEAKSRAEHDALAKKDRAEHERIDEQSAERLRKLLGDDGYRRFAEWLVAHHAAGHAPGDGPQRGPHAPAADKVALAGEASGDADDY